MHAFEWYFARKKKDKWWTRGGTTLNWSVFFFNTNSRKNGLVKEIGF